jgi:hypothetical protein
MSSASPLWFAVHAAGNVLMFGSSFSDPGMASMVGAMIPFPTVVLAHGGHAHLWAPPNPAVFSSALPWILTLAYSDVVNADWVTYYESGWGIVGVYADPSDAANDWNAGYSRGDVVYTGGL